MSCIRCTRGMSSRCDPEAKLGLQICCMTERYVPSDSVCSTLRLLHQREDEPLLRIELLGTLCPLLNRKDLAAL